MLYVTSGDIYYLRLILLNRKARSDRDVLTYVPVRGGGEPIVCSSYQQSAIAHGYVDSIQDVTLTYDDMCSNGTASQCRSYCVVLSVHGYATHAIFDDYERRLSSSVGETFGLFGVLWAAVWYYTTLLVRTATDRPYLRILYLI